MKRQRGRKEAAGTVHPITTDFTPWGQIFLLCFCGGEMRRKSMGQRQRNMLKGLVAPKVPPSGTFVDLVQSLKWNLLFPRRKVRQRRETENEDDTDASLDQSPTLMFSSLLIYNPAAPKPLCKGGLPQLYSQMQGASWIILYIRRESQLT